MVFVDGPGCVIVIPARYGSTRLPGKPLLAETGKCLIQHVHERALAVTGVASVIVATDDARIADVVRGFGGTVVMTRADCPTGTDRVAEAVRGRTEPFVINIQGDEPEIPPAAIEEVLAALVRNPDVPMATAVAPLADPADLARPQVVKVVTDARGRALYFSRAAIPHVRDPFDSSRPGTPYLRHIGIYGFRREFLGTFVRLPEGRLERLERLEQLRAIEAGYPIQTATVEYTGVSIDTPEDYARFVAGHGR